MNVASIVGMVGLAVLGLLLGWWLGKSAETRAVNTLLAGKEAELAGKTAELAASERRSKDLESRNTQQESEIQCLRAEQRSTEMEKTRSEEKLKAAQQSLADERVSFAGLKQEMEKTFRSLAGDILDQKTKSFSEGSQKELGTLLSPLRTQIDEFRKKVEQAQSDSNNGVTKLETLIGVLATQSQDISEKAENLATALRGSAKTQGDWGEFILRDLLDKCGLREGEQYSFQQTFSGITGEDGERTKSVRTDVILILPGGRNLVIDSKVSLTAYTDYVSAADEGARSAALKQHLASVRGHVNGLCKAGYHRLPDVETPDFVVMFVPVEPAFLVALQNDSDLWSNAYKQGILLVGPTTLLYVIRIVSVLWQQELQAQNVKEVMDRGAELYDKFVGFVSDLESVGKNLRAADQSYGTAMKKLSEGRGNLVRQVEMLKELGVRATKALPRTLLDRSEAREISLSLAAAEERQEE